MNWMTPTFSILLYLGVLSCTTFRAWRLAHPGFPDYGNAGEVEERNGAWRDPCQDLEDHILYRIFATTICLAVAVAMVCVFCCVVDEASHKKISKYLIESYHRNQAQHINYED